MNPPHPRARSALQKLDAGQICRLTLLVAPEGAGKNQILREWTENRFAGHQIPAWLVLEPQDNNPEHFIQRLQSKLIPSAPLGTGASGNNPQDDLVDLINILAGTAGQATLVLEDYQVINNPEIHILVDILLEYIPPQLKIIMTSSSEPPLSIPRLRARRQVIEIGPADLAEL